MTVVALGRFEVAATLNSRKGVATIEFALVAPLLISLLLGIGDIAPATMARYKFGNATQSVADLATQFPQMRLSDMADVFAGGASVLAPFASTTLSLRITNTVSDGAGRAFVYWSCATGTFSPTTAKTTVTTTATGASVDTVLLRTSYNAGGYSYNGLNTSYVTVEGSYIYTAPARFVLTTPQIMGVVAYMAPRQSSYIGFPWNGDPNTPPPVPTATKKVKSTTLSNGAVCSYAA